MYVENAICALVPKILALFFSKKDKQVGLQRSDAVKIILQGLRSNLFLKIFSDAFNNTLGIYNHLYTTTRLVLSQLNTECRFGIKNRFKDFKQFVISLC